MMGFLFAAIISAAAVAINAFVVVNQPSAWMNWLALSVCATCLGWNAASWFWTRKRF